MIWHCMDFLFVLSSVVVIQNDNTCAVSAVGLRMVSIAHFLCCEMELNTVGKDIPLLLWSEEKRGIMHKLQKSPLTCLEYQLVFPLLNGMLMLNEES